MTDTERIDDEVFRYPGWNRWLAWAMAVLCLGAALLFSVGSSDPVERGMTAGLFILLAAFNLACLRPLRDTVAIGPRGIARNTPRRPGTNVPWAQIAGVKLRAWAMVLFAASGQVLLRVPAGLQDGERLYRLVLDRVEVNDPSPARREFPEPYFALVGGIVLVAAFVWGAFTLAHNAGQRLFILAGVAVGLAELLTRKRVVVGSVSVRVQGLFGAREYRYEDVVDARIWIGRYSCVVLDTRAAGPVSLPRPRGGVIAELMAIRRAMRSRGLTPPPEPPRPATPQELARRASGLRRTWLVVHGAGLLMGAFAYAVLSLGHAIPSDPVRTGRVATGMLIVAVLVVCGLYVARRRAVVKQRALLTLWAYTVAGLCFCYDTTLAVRSGVFALFVGPALLSLVVLIAFPAEAADD